MTFKKALRRTFGIKSKSKAIPHEFVVGDTETLKANPQEVVETSRSDSPDLDVSGSKDFLRAKNKATNNVGTGDESDLVCLRLGGWKQLVKSYLVFFESVVKLYQQSVDTYQTGTDILKAPVKNDFLFIPADEEGENGCAMVLQSFLADQLKFKAQAGLKNANNVVDNLERLLEEVREKTHDYSSRIGLIFTNLNKCRRGIEELEQTLEKAVEMVKIEAEAPKAGDPYLHNVNMRTQIAKYVDMENTLYNAVKSELEKLSKWEPLFLQNLNNVVTGFLTWEAGNGTRNSELQTEVIETFSKVLVSSEWTKFATKYKNLLANPQNCGGNSNVSDYQYSYMDSPVLKVVKRGKLQRESIGSMKNGKYINCQAIITEGGFLHVLDEAPGVKVSSTPNVTIYLPSISLAPLDSPALPRSAFMIYTKKGSAKTTAITTNITNKNKYVFKAENYEEMKGWWETIHQYTTVSILEIFELEEPTQSRKPLAIEDTPKTNLRIQDANSVRSVLSSPPMSPQGLPITAMPEPTPTQPQLAQPAQPLLLTGTGAIEYGNASNQVFSYYPVQQPNGQIVYVPLIQNSAVEEPADGTDATSTAPPSNRASFMPQESGAQAVGTVSLSTPSGVHMMPQMSPFMPQFTTMYPQSPMMTPPSGPNAYPGFTVPSSSFPMPNGLYGNPQLQAQMQAQAQARAQAQYMAQMQAQSMTQAQTQTQAQAQTQAQTQTQSQAEVQQPQAQVPAEENFSTPQDTSNATSSFSSDTSDPQTQTQTKQTEQTEHTTTNDSSLPSKTPQPDTAVTESVEPKSSSTLIQE
ncbi:Phosphatidylinositol 4,5-bisphosphate-binding protein SLM1 [Zancudomyces culisetae]|uniref:Phosphatidylinositol 4,5-bisphosphate-binding protein SLM1 n=1 Tax=Zancudomyces culisetae TaxID=1213189 RepID=A0A1R1PSQ7_ZANCU|nr:Phosphatidylinositol 4,5-bisphosphate-binding protein SLM1 [Zancudomyces culisetae]|eukprot:OMH84026.1 Phosphatidylinositol 4,5-bisphosphate-binding protein SLM1 [Zancudomyces culisetae]